jgi:HSP20 family protein
MFGHCRTGGSAAAHHHHRFAQYQPQDFSARFGGGFKRPKYNVPTNIVRNDNNLEIHIYALGFEKANMTISVTGDTLYVGGTRTIAEDYKPNFVRQEYPIKSFERVFELSDAIDSANIVAKQENGVLILTLPIKPEAQPASQTIEVQ